MKFSPWKDCRRSGSGWSTGGSFSDRKHSQETEWLLKTTRWATECTDREESKRSRTVFTQMKMWVQKYFYETILLIKPFNISRTTPHRKLISGTVIHLHLLSQNTQKDHNWQACQPLKNGKKITRVSWSTVFEPSENNFVDVRPFWFFQSSEIQTWTVQSINVYMHWFMDGSHSQ